VQGEKIVFFSLHWHVVYTPVAASSLGGPNILLSTLSAVEHPQSLFLPWRDTITITVYFLSSIKLGNTLIEVCVRTLKLSVCVCVCVLGIL